MRRMITTKQENYIKDLNSHIEIIDGDLSIDSVNYSYAFKNDGLTIKHYENEILDFNQETIGGGPLLTLPQGLFISARDQSNKLSSISTTTSAITLNAEVERGLFSEIVIENDPSNTKQEQITLTSSNIVMDRQFRNSNNLKVLIKHLPTSDPQVADQLWNDNGVLKISAGA